MKYEDAINSIPHILKESTNALIVTPEHCAKRFESTADLAQETFNVLTLDTKNKEIDRHTISVGTLNSSLVHPRDLFRIAINDNAAALILSHNHPSGDPTPSSEDIKVTKQLVAAGQVMGIKILDHIIIGRKADNARRESFLSIRECGLVNFA